MDSLLVTNQFNRTYAVKNQRLASHLKILKNFASKFEDFYIKHVPREDNTKVNTLANLGSAFMIHPYIKIPICHLLRPVIEDTRNKLKYNLPMRN